MSNDLMDERRCRAKSKRTGQRCRRFPAPGGTVCHFHGGSAPAVRAAAARRVQEAEAAALLDVLWNPDADPVINPIPALQQLAGRLRHTADVLGARLSTTGDLDAVTSTAWLRVLRELRHALEGMERLDLEGKQVELEHAKAEMVGLALVAGFTAVELPPERVEAFMSAFRGRIRGGQPVVPGELLAGRPAVIAQVLGDHVDPARGAE